MIRRKLIKLNNSLSCLNKTQAFVVILTPSCCINNFQVLKRVKMELDYSTALIMQGITRKWYLGFDISRLPHLCVPNHVFGGARPL
jgi:hypothetical protein